ncbi:MAG: winged helix-turn-helix domain-containing protein [Caldilineaceae bacterium]
MHELKNQLEAQTFSIHCCRSLDEGSIWSSRRQHHPPDAAIIDIPGERSSQSMNAFKFYDFVRRGGWIASLQQRFTGWGEGIPVLMLVDEQKRLEVEERMFALGVQPDRIDYKPYRISILTNKLNSLFPPAAENEDTPSTSILHIRSMVIDPENETVMVNSQNIKLSQLEFQLLHYMASRPDTPLTREQLLADIWGITGRKALNNRNVDVYVGRLRKKLSNTECADMISRGRNGAYILETDSWLETLTEPEGVRRGSTTSAARKECAYLLRESNEPHLPREFNMQHAQSNPEFKAGVKIGRNANMADWVIMDRRVSRWHATLFLDHNTFYIRDENSTGHTFLSRPAADGSVNRTRLSPRANVPLESGDILHFNTVSYRFEVR